MIFDMKTSDYEDTDSKIALLELQIKVLNHRLNQLTDLVCMMVDNTEQKQ